MLEALVKFRECVLVLGAHVFKLLVESESNIYTMNIS